MTAKKKPAKDDAERCIDIRCRSKRGKYVSPEDRKFCQKMNRQYPTWYGKSEARVFNETLPFGSNARADEDESWTR